MGLWYDFSSVLIWSVLQIIFFPISIVLVKFEMSQYWPELGFWNQYPLCWWPDSGIIILYIMFCYHLTELTVLCWFWLWLFLDIFFKLKPKWTDLKVSADDTIKDETSRCQVNVNFGHTLKNFQNKLTCNLLVILIPWFVVMSTFSVWLWRLLLQGISVTTNYQGKTIR